MAAADAYARGRPIGAAPPSLRLWALGKALPGLDLGLNVLAEPYELMRELECYAEAVNAEKARQAQRARRKR